jgi:hypothetical protein
MEAPQRMRGTADAAVAGRAEHTGPNVPKPSHCNFLLSARRWAGGRTVGDDDLPLTRSSPSSGGE